MDIGMLGSQSSKMNMWYTPPYGNEEWDGSGIKAAFMEGLMHMGDWSSGMILA